MTRNEKKNVNEQPAIKPTEIENLNGIGLKLDRVQTIITDCGSEHKGDDEIILYVPECSEYDTDFIQGDCAILHFSPAQAKKLARNLWKFASSTPEKADAETYAKVVSHRSNCHWNEKNRMRSTTLKTSYERGKKANRYYNITNKRIIKWN